MRWVDAWKRTDVGRCPGAAIEHAESTLVDAGYEPAGAPTTSTAERIRGPSRSAPKTENSQFTLTEKPERIGRSSPIESLSLAGFKRRVPLRALAVLFVLTFTGRRLDGLCNRLLKNVHTNQRITHTLSRMVAA